MTEPFIRALAKIVVSQICEDNKFYGIQRSAADTLADILLRYIGEIGEAAHSYAEHAGRTESNFHDIRLAFDDLGVSMEDIVAYVDAVEETPFARPIPRFPIPKKSKRKVPSFFQKGEQPPRESMPPWLPALPDRHTYMTTPVWPERKSDPKKDQVEQGREKRRAEQSLVELHHRIGLLTSGNSREPSGDEPLERSGKPDRLWGEMSRLPCRQQLAAAAQGTMPATSQLPSGKRPGLAAAANPYLASPADEASVQVTPLADFGYSVEDLGNGEADKKGGDMETGVNVLQAFSEIMEAGKKAKEHDDDEGGSEGKRDSEREIGKSHAGSLWSGWSAPPAKDRSLVSLSFDWGSKMRRNALEARQLFALKGESKSKEDKGGAMARDKKERGKEDDKDEKRKRAEQILEQAEKMEREAERGGGMERQLID